MFIAISSLLVLAATVLAMLSIGDVWDQFASRTVRHFEPKLRALSLDSNRQPLLMRAWGISILLTIGIIGIVLQMYPVAFAICLIIVVAPRYILEFLIRRRRIKLRDQMVGVSTALSNSCRAGLTLAQGLEAIGQDTPQPLSDELKKIVADYNLGRSLPASIRETKARLNEESFTLFSSAILVCIEQGGKITEALERISTSLQDRQRVERKLESDTASGTAVVWMLSLFPFGYLVFSSQAFPEGAMLMFGTLIGQFVLASVIILVALGCRWCQKIVSTTV